MGKRGDNIVAWNNHFEKDVNKDEWRNEFCIEKTRKAQSEGWKIG